MKTTVIIVSILLSVTPVKGISGIKAGFGETFSLDKLLSDTSDHFINGWEYGVEPAGSGHPFALHNSWSPDTIISALGHRCQYSMNYDVYKDELIIQTFLKAEPHSIVLNPLYIKSFWLKEHFFVNADYVPELKHSGLSGYYEILYKGSFSALLKHRKQLSAGRNTKGSAYESDNSYLLVKDGRVYPLRRKKDLGKVFHNQKKEIIKYMSTHQFFIRSAQKEDWQKLFHYIDKN